MMLLGYVNVSYAKNLEFGVSRFPPLVAPREQNAPLWNGIGWYGLARPYGPV